MDNIWIIVFKLIIFYVNLTFGNLFTEHLRTELLLHEEIWNILRCNDKTQRIAVVCDGHHISHDEGIQGLLRGAQ